MSEIRIRWRHFVKMQKLLFRYLFGIPNKMTPPEYNATTVDDVITSRALAKELKELRIALIGKNVQGFWDTGEIDEYGAGMCVEVERRGNIKEGDSPYVYIIQFPDGERTRTRNARLIR